MGKNKRNIFKRSSKTRVSPISNKTAASEKSIGSEENVPNEDESQPVDKYNKKNEKYDLKTHYETEERNDTNDNNLKNVKLDRKKMKEKAKQISDNNRSLKRKKKKNVVRQILSGFQQPKEVVNATADGKENYAMSPHPSNPKDQLRSSSRNNQRGVLKRESSNRQDEYQKDNPTTHHHTNGDARNGDGGSENKMANEEIYQSRKLLIRQMQGMIAKNEHKTSRQSKGKGNVHRKSGEVVSEYDSWSDLEENFAKGFNLILHTIFLSLPFTHLFLPNRITKMIK